MNEIVGSAFMLRLDGLHAAQFCGEVGNLLHGIVNRMRLLLHGAEQDRQLLLPFGQHRLLLLYFSFQLKRELILLLQNSLQVLQPSLMDLAFGL